MQMISLENTEKHNLKHLKVHVHTYNNFDVKRMKRKKFL